ncbi:MAG: hypothetical protein HY706_00485 [Candidatus Hydrogenedentes bacterium]|nr:hypothetical protein [Candidatus Hydrogenedentota bacterium]
MNLPVCAECEPEEEADFDKVRAALEKTPNQSAEELAESTGVSRECILRLLEQGRVRNVAPTETVRCGRCGAPAISLTKRLCETCLQKLNIELAQEQAKIKLPPKRSVTILGGASVRDILDEKRNV